MGGRGRLTRTDIKRVTLHFEPNGAAGEGALLEETTVSSILMLVGRKAIFLNVYHTSEDKAIEAARVVAAVA